MRVLIAGGRKFSGIKDYFSMCDVLDDLEITEIIQGGAKGADALAKEYAIAHSIPYVTVPAEWNKHGKAAGPIRNQVMADLEPDLVVLFPGGAGTNSMHNIAVKKGLKVLDYRS